MVLGWLLLSGVVLADCRLYFADQYDFGNNLGFALDLEAAASGTAVCQLSSMNLVLGVADGKAFHWIVVTPKWQTGHVYEVKGVIDSTGSTLYLDGQVVGKANGGFQPLDRYVASNLIPSWASGAAAYAITQLSLSIDDGTSHLSLPPQGQSPLPPPLLLMSPPPQWQGAFATQARTTTTITATFRIDPPAGDPHQYDPYVDQYGQITFSDWDSKTHSDDELAAAAATERAWLDAHAPLPNLDSFGGSTSAGWQDVATGFYHTAFVNGRWWLITPLGNPCFYLSISDVSQKWQYTPITGRAGMFASLPARTGTFAEAWGTNVWNEGGNTLYYSFQISNMIRKYGSGWIDRANAMVNERALKWGFAGVGKWSPKFDSLPVMPVLNRADVPVVVKGGHPDVFDPAIQQRLTDSLTRQTAADVNNPYIVGYTVGSEIDEVVLTAEIPSILGLGANVPAKRALVDYALAQLYKNDVSALSTAWKVKAASVADVYTAVVTGASAADIEALRRYFASSYYSAIYQTMKSVDPNHLYLGWWLVPNWWVNDSDWKMQAANTDVMGIDYYVPKFAEPYVDALIRDSGKPVLVGEFSFPGGYGGWRGFDLTQYSGNTTLSDSESGDRYAQWLADTSAHPYVVGVSWFEYRDEPVAGRGPGFGPAVVIGEHDAFGLVDTTDQPKYALIEKILAANIAALVSLGLQ